LVTRTLKGCSKAGRFFSRTATGFLPVIVADGEVVGTWKRRKEKGKVVVKIQPFAKLDEEQMKGAREAAKRYGEFLEVPIATSFDN
jgi:Winged helix DNA-binding domain